MARPINQNKLEIWIYQLMLGTLDKKKKELLKKELENRYENDKIHTALELKVYVAMKVDRPFRKFLGEMLADWERRS